MVAPVPATSFASATAPVAFTPPPPPSPPLGFGRAFFCLGQAAAVRRRPAGYADTIGGTSICAAARLPTSAAEAGGARGAFLAACFCGDVRRRPAPRALALGQGLIFFFIVVTLWPSDPHSGTLFAVGRGGAHCGSWSLINGPHAGDGQ